MSFSPTMDTLVSFFNLMTKWNSTTLVRVCEPTYDISQLTAKGIKVFDWYFQDGASPPKWVINAV